MKKILLILAVLVTVYIFYLGSHNKQVDNSSLRITSNEIRYKNYLLESKESLPRLFIQSPLILNTNAKYSYSIFNNLDSGTEFIRVDKKIIQTGTAWFDNITAFYTYDKQTNQYKRVLVSSKEQNNARFPQTNIINPDNLTVKFYYDVSRPNQCYGYDCLSFWADFYRWDNNKNEFIQVNQEHKSFYQDLYKQYEEMNKKGCSLEDVESKGLITFEDVYKSNNTNCCKGSTRAELNKFFETKDKISKLIK